MNTNKKAFIEAKQVCLTFENNNILNNYTKEK